MKSMSREMQFRGVDLMGFNYIYRPRWLLSGTFLMIFCTGAFATEGYGISGRPTLSEPYFDLARPVEVWQPSTGKDQPQLGTVTSNANEEIRQILQKSLTISNLKEIFPQVSDANRRGFAAFYAERDYQPLWIEGGNWSSRAVRVINRLDRADEDALEPDTYRVSKLQSDNLDAKTLAYADLALSQAVVSYARDARGARINLAQLSKLITPKLELPDVEAILSHLATDPDTENALASYNPQHQGYLALKEKLTEFRDYTASIAPDSDSRDSVNQNPNTDILKKNSEKSPNIAEIIANMERWRWLPSDLGDDRIEVNLPEYTARVIRNGQLVHETRVIIGKQSTPTPLFSNKMVHLIVNPSWHVPASIVNKEILPKLAEDPEYAVRNGYEITELDSGKMSIRQPPGGGNALGFIKFMFPNEHAVYLHDTPSRKLFANFQRAYSHGCVRVENPFELAAILLDRPEYSEPRLKAMIGKGERLIRLKEPLPIHITYFTLSVDESGAIRKLADVYGYDKSVAYALRKQPSKAVAALRRTVE